jgi:Zn-dependent peptidase ImmA (M78 family)
VTPDRAAAKALESAGIREPAVDVWALADHLGVRVERTDLGEDCSGVLVRHGDAAVIGVHFAHPITRQRFTLAHELAHFLLHPGPTYVDRVYQPRGMSLQFRDTVSGTGTVKEEMEANQFAAALLMPAPWVREEFARHRFDLGDDATLLNLCRRFGVSIHAMTYRLMNLGLLPGGRSRRRATR